MEAGEAKQAGKPCERRGVSPPVCRRSFVLPFFLLAGCATGQPHIERALMADKGLVARSEHAADSYTVSCPDLLEIVVAGHPEWSGLREIGADGRLSLGSAGRVRVEGRRLPDVARSVAEAAEVPPDSVRVRVAEYRSQQVYLIGQIVGLQRVVPYRGPETVLDLLHRAGGLTPGAAPEDVFVVRSRVAEGTSPQVFRVDLHAILFHDDPRTNICLQPFDQVFVGETRQFGFSKCVPPWLMPIYDAVVGNSPTAKNPPNSVTRTP